MTPERASTLEAVAHLLACRDVGHPLRVGVDGVCGAGKSTFTRELAVAVERTGRPVVHVDSDGFHHVRERRYRQGRASARGYYEDAYDFDSLADRVLRPLGPGGDRRYAVEVHDLASDAVISDHVARAPADAVVLFDATFLQRGTLRELWDEVIYLDAYENAALSRGIARDAEALGGREAAAQAYEDRYMAACRLYVAEESPRERASIVLSASDPDALRTMRPVVLAASAVIHDQDGQVLLIRRGTEPGKGLWSVPGGSADPGETLTETAGREAREETGLDVSVGRELWSVQVPSGDGRIYEIHDFAAVATGGTLQAGDDADEARWVHHSRLDDLELTDNLAMLIRGANLFGDEEARCAEQR